MVVGKKKVEKFFCVGQLAKFGLRVAASGRFFHKFASGIASWLQAARVF
jgi:hypothetical protein